MKKFDWTPPAEEELISIQDQNTFSDKSDRTSSTFKKDEMITSTENKNKAMEKIRKKWMPLHFEETAPKGSLISMCLTLAQVSKKGITWLHDARLDRMGFLEPTLL